MSLLVPASQLPTAVATVVASVGVAAVYLYVGYRLSRRKVSSGARLASMQFSLWWAGLGVSVLVTGFEVALAALNLLPLSVALTGLFVGLIIDCVFLWGLVGFLTFVYTGRYHLLTVSAFYAAFYVVVLYYEFSRNPNAVIFQAGEPTVQYASGASVPLELVVVLGLIGPVVGGAVLYLSLLRRTHDSAQRYRIALVGGAILLWFAIDVFLPSSTAAWVLMRGVLEVVPGLMSLIAFFPPAWARQRYGATTSEIQDPESREAVAEP